MRYGWRKGVRRRRRREDSGVGGLVREGGKRMSREEVGEVE